MTGLCSYCRHPAASHTDIRRCGAERGYIHQDGQVFGPPPGLCDCKFTEAEIYAAKAVASEMQFRKPKKRSAA